MRTPATRFRLAAVAAFRSLRPLAWSQGQSNCGLPPSARPPDLRLLRQRCMDGIEVPQMFIGLVESGDAAIKRARGLSVFKRRCEVGSQFALGADAVGVGLLFDLAPPIHSSMPPANQASAPANRSFWFTRVPARVTLRS